MRGHELCIPRYIDITAETDLSDLKSGALLAAFGLDLIRLTNPEKFELSSSDLASFNAAKTDLQDFALGKTIRTWVEADYQDHDPDPEDYDPEPPQGYYATTNVPGKLVPPVPRLRKEIQDIRASLAFILKILTVRGDKKLDFIVLFDGLDRLITPDKFWSVADQDFRILKQLGVSVFWRPHRWLSYMKAERLQSALIEFTI